MKLLGSLEESALLIVMYLADAYGVSVAAEYRKLTGKGISIPAIHTVLKRLEEKGFLSSKMGETSPERGGKRKRIYEATNYGLRISKEIQRERFRMWSKIPELKWNKY